MDNVAAEGEAPLNCARQAQDLSTLVTAVERLRTGQEFDDDCFKALQSVGVLRMLIPEDLGGVAAEPVHAMELIEDISAVGGSVGWISFAGVTGGIFATELPSAGAQEVYADPDILVAYAGFAGGVAIRHARGFELSGHWPMASGLSHASWLALGCRSEDRTAVAMVPRGACSVMYGWDPVGLTGTATGSVKVDSVLVPPDLMVWDGHNLEQRRKMRYRMMIPSLMASVSLGLARATLEEVALGFAEAPTRPGTVRSADSEQVQHVLGRAHAEVCGARAFLREVTESSWRRLSLGEDLGLERGALLRLAATHAATVAAEATSAVAKLAGIRGVTTSQAITRRWLDARMVTANVTVRDLYYRVYGGVVVGGDIPDSWP
jgi:alkylation response protein AidB-like acyl-CoA dehydrogenase